MARTWASDEGIQPPGLPIDRDAGEGPPRCCKIRRVAADALAWWGGHPAALLARARAAHPHWNTIADQDLYVCSACQERLLALKVVTREELARAFGLSDRIIAHAWMHDEEFHRRGPQSAPPEARAQSWWADYVTAWNGPPERRRGVITALFHGWSIQG